VPTDRSPDMTITTTAGFGFGVLVLGFVLQRYKRYDRYPGNPDSDVGLDDDSGD
jgi:hypothetical protein